MLACYFQFAQEASKFTVYRHQEKSSQKSLACRPLPWELMLMKRKTFEAGLSQGMNPKRKMIRTSPKTAELNKKVVEIVDKCNIKGIPVSGVQLREAFSI